MASVCIEGVTKRFGDVVAVRDFTLDVRDREFLVLVGPSGCGKSTMLRMIAGLEEVNEGSIRIGDRVVNDLAPKDRDIAMVFQNYALYPHMNVYRNMAFGLKMRGYPRAEIDARVREAARILEIENLIDRKPAQLSGGQRQRVAMGRAIVRKPAVFLFDEPLSNLDAKLRVQMRLEIKRLHSKLATTVIYVTHDQTEAMTLADRVAVMRDGVLQQVASPQVVYERPANVFVASFLGSPTINLVPATVDSRDGSLVAAAEGFSVRLPETLGGVVGGLVGRPILLGVRAEHLHASSLDGVPTARVRGVVEVVETLGSELIAHVRVGAHLLAVKARADAGLAVGREAELFLEMEEVKLFDPESGINLLEQEEGSS